MKKQIQLMSFSKKEILQVPPNYEEIPEPGKLLQKENKKEDEIKNFRSPSKEDKKIKIIRREFDLNKINK